MKKLKVLLVGICGYGGHTVDALLDTQNKEVEIAGLVDPYPVSCVRLQELFAAHIPLYRTMEEFYAEHEADLAVINTPIQFHTEHILIALRHGSNVLCEKPLCAEEKDIDIIIEARHKAGKFVDIGYQWSHNDAVLRLKTDILNGVYGKPVALKSLTLWPRNDAYYHRGCGWAGKLYDDSGRAVFDSIANNAAAHHLHNLFFLCGSDLNSSMSPVNFDAILMRTNLIETFDTCVLSGMLENGASFLFAASHATERRVGPVCELVFEKGTVRLGNPRKNIENPIFYGTLNDGTMIEYGDPEANNIRKLWLCIENAGNEELGRECCPVEAAAVHTRVINELHRSFVIHPTRQALTMTRLKGEKIFTYVKGLDDALISLYEGLPVNLCSFFEESL